MRRLVLVQVPTHVALAATCCILAQPHSGFAQRANSTLTADAVLRAWKERQAAVKTLDVAWVETKTLHKGYYYHPDQGAQMNPKNWTVPDHDETFPVKHSLILDHEKARYQLNGQAWTADSPPKLKAEESLATFDGKSAKILWQPGAANDFPTGYILETPKEQLNVIPLIPLMLVYRAFDPDIKSFGNRHFRLASQLESVIDGQNCAALVDSTAFPNGRLVVWVEKTAGFFPRRCMAVAGDKIAWQLDFEYGARAEVERALVGWKTAILAKNQRLQTSSVCRVTKTVFNSPVRPEQFTLDFPRGTRVTDHATKTDYLVKSGGEKRFITPEEKRKASYRQLLDTETGTALFGRPAFYLSGWFRLVTFAAMVSLVVLIVIRRAKSADKRH